jgi:CBS domain-containing protein
MLRSSIPFGRLFGVEVRVHLAFLLLLALSVGYSAAVLNNVGRGLGLWLALCFAVIVREVARSLAALYSGFRLRALLLLPVGGVMAFAPREPSKPAPGTRLITAAGPVANTFMGLLLMGFCYGLEPKASLFVQPWISFHYVLRSTIWMQFVIAAFNLLPIAAAPSRQFLRQRTPEPAPVVRSANPAFGLGAAMAVAIVLAGFVFSNVWFIFFGGLVLLWAQLRMGTPLDTLESASILVSDVMLTEYTLLSSSDTLGGALAQTSHSLQDVFPVVRGDRLVGAISRDTLASRLATDGDGYLQAAMTRNLPFAEPSEKLVDALRRASALGASEFIPVLDDRALLGILTPHSLSRAVHQVRLTRPPQANRNES